jgi:hypothetical protein
MTFGEALNAVENSEMTSAAVFSGQSGLALANDRRSREA